MARPKRSNQLPIPAPRLKAIREYEGLTQIELGQLATDFARQYDPNEPEISQQTIGKLEKGLIPMTDRWAFIFSSTFNKNNGRDEYKPWHIFASAEDIEKYLKSAEEVAEIAARRSLTEQEQSTYAAMHKTMVETILAMREKPIR